MNTSQDLSKSPLSKKCSKLVSSLNIIDKLEPLEIIHAKSHPFGATIQGSYFVQTILRVLKTDKILLGCLEIRLFLSRLLMRQTIMELNKLPVIIKLAERVIRAFRLLFFEFCKRKLLTWHGLEIVGSFEIIIIMECLC